MSRRCLLSVLACLLGLLDAGAAAKPSILFCIPHGPGRRYLDLQWARELHAEGYQIDYLDEYTDFSLERLQQYNVAVIYGCPPQKPGESSHNSAPKGPRRDEFVKVCNDYVRGGGGLFCILYPQEPARWNDVLIAPWGARLPFEFLNEARSSHVAQMPHMRARTFVFLADQVATSPVSAGVRNLWLPYHNDYRANSSWTAPLDVDDNWTVVVRASKTAATAPIDIGQGKWKLPPPPNALVRPNGVAAPPLAAIRELGKGRVFLTCQMPQHSLGQGTKWLYDRVSLSAGVNGVPSDVGRLYRNVFDWLGAPALAAGAPGGFTTPAGRLDPPNYRPEVRKQFEEYWYSQEELDYHRPPLDGELYKGLLGVKTTFSSGTGTVAEYAAAARQLGLDFLIFMDDFAKLTPDKLAQLDAQCRELSGDDLLLLPGYSIDVNTGNRMFFYGNGLPWPLPECLTGPDNTLLNMQYEDQDGNFTTDKPVLRWILSDHNRAGRKEDQQNMGFYDFREPTAMKAYDVRLCSSIALRYYADGKLVEDCLDDYLLSAPGTIPCAPIAVNVVRSPAELTREVQANHGLVYGQARTRELLMLDALRYNKALAGPNVFTSDGPMIRAWPQCWRSMTYGAEPYVAGRDLMLAPLHVTSDVGLKELRIYNGTQLFRRILPGGAKEFNQVLQLPCNIHRIMILVAEDVNGGRAVSFARRAWKFTEDMRITFCGDHQNDCKSSGSMLSKGPGTFMTARVPDLLGGITWDGGPQGRNPIAQFDVNVPIVDSDKGQEGQQQFNNVPVVEFGDDQVLVVRSVLERIFDEKLPGTAWQAYMYAPSYPSKLIAGYRRYIQMNRPSIGVQPTHLPHWAERTGAYVCCFDSHVVFKQDQDVQRLALIRSQPSATAWPVRLAVGTKRGCEVIDLTPDGRNAKIELAAGDWLALYSTEITNDILFINRGDPIQFVAIPRPDGVNCRFEAPAIGPVKAGDTRHYSLFSVFDALDAPHSGADRALQITHYLADPSGMEVVRGQRQDGIGFVELAADDYAVEVKVPQAPERLGFTLPLRVHGLNPNWSAGILQIAGHSTGYYHDGTNVYGAVGMDFDGLAYAAIYPDMAALTHVRLGHPVVCDQADVMINVVARPSQTDGVPYQWHVDVNNPTDVPITATFRQAMAVPGLSFADVRITLAPGEYRVLMD